MLQTTARAHEHLLRERCVQSDNALLENGTEEGSKASAGVRARGFGFGHETFSNSALKTDNNKCQSVSMPRRHTPPGVWQLFN